MTETLTPDLLGKLARAALDNASDLLADAKLLLDAGRFPRALALTVLAAEEFGKHMMCMSAGALDLADEAEVREFWKRFRSHETKYQNWRGQLIDFTAINPAEPWDPDDGEPDLWDEMWQEMPDAVKFAMDMKMSALYVDARGGEPTSPSDLVSVEFVTSVWESVRVIVRRTENLWEGADLSEYVEAAAPRMQKLREEMERAKETGDLSVLAGSFGDLLGFSGDEWTEFQAALTARMSEEE